MTKKNYDFSEFITQCLSYDTRSEILEIIQREIKECGLDTLKVVTGNTREVIAQYNKDLDLLARFLTLPDNPSSPLPPFMTRDKDGVRPLLQHFRPLLQHLCDKNEFSHSLMSQIYSSANGF